MPDYRRNNPILQALHTSAKLHENTSQKIGRGYKDYAVAQFFNGLRQLDKPPDYDAARKRALDAYMTPEGKDAATSAATKNESATTSGDAATLAAVADKIATGARRIEMQNYLAQVDHMERNELKRQYIQRNLGLISQMDPGEQSALAMGAGGSAAALTDASSGFLARMMGGRGGGMGGLGDGAKNEWTTIEVMQDGKRIIARMNKDTGEIIPTGFGGVGGGSGGGGGADQTAKVYDIGRKKVLRVNMAGRTIEEMAALAKNQGGRLVLDPEGIEGWIGFEFNEGGRGGGGGGQKALTEAQEAALYERGADLRRAQQDYDAAVTSGDKDAITAARNKLRQAHDDFNAKARTQRAAAAGWTPSGGFSQKAPIRVKIGSAQEKEILRKARSDHRVTYFDDDRIRRNLASTGEYIFE